MDLVNGGHINHCHVQTDLDASAIRGVMIKKRETLKAFEREIAQLVEKKGEIEKDLVRLGTALRPACNHNMNLLPNEILGRVFTLVVRDHGLPVAFPMRKGITPPQLVISHVCSHWRRVALCTPELWSNTQLTYLADIDPQRLAHLTWLHQRWLARAGTFPVSLSISFDDSGSMKDYEIANALQRIILPFRVKRLHLALSYQTFMNLTISPSLESALSDFTEVSVNLTVLGDETVSSEEINNQYFIPRLRSITFETLDWIPLDCWLRLNHQSLPWSQLRSVEVDDIALDDLELLVNILHQIPMLQALKLGACPFHFDSLQKTLTMSSLLDFSLKLDVEEDMVYVNYDKILRSFICPSLTKFKLHGSSYWTTETVEILKRQYNLQRLEKVEFHGVALPVSHLLRSAPMLHSFSIGRLAILDDDTIIGISNGTLAQRLRELVLSCTCDIGEVLGMVEARKKTVDALIDNGCTWKEEITVLRKVALRGINEYRERIKTLREAGISITFTWP